MRNRARLLQRGFRMLAGGMLAGCLLATLCWPAMAGARWQNLADVLFQHWGTAQGLPQSFVTALAEDGQGFIWVGTQGGLARWDGYQFRKYAAAPSEPHGLLDGYIETLHTDRLGRLWIGSTSGGAARYDPEQDYFIRLLAGKGGLSHVAVRAIADDGTRGLWFGTDAGLDYLSFADNQIHAEPAPPGQKALGQIHALLPDAKGNLWIGTEHGLWRRDKEGRLQASSPMAGLDDTINTLMQDRAGRIWVGSHRHGAFVLDPASGQFAPVLENGRKDSALSNEWVVKIIEAGDGEVWIGTFGRGLVIVRPNQGETRRIVHDPALSGSLPHNGVMAAIKDRSGLVWLGTQRGLVRYDPQQNSLLSLMGGRDRPGAIRDSDVRSVLQADDGRLWLGLGNNGVDIIDPVSGKINSLYVDSAHPESALQKDRIGAMVQAPDHSVYIGTDRGLYQADARGARVRRLDMVPRDPALPIRMLYHDGQRLWLGGSNDGLWYRDEASGQLLRPASHEQLTDQRISAFMPGPAGSVWVGTRNGLNLVTPDRLVQRILPAISDAQGLPLGLISSLLTDNKGRMWVATQGGGIAVTTEPYQAQGGNLRFVRLTLANGLPDMNINVLLQDRRGQIWASTDAGIASIDPDSLAIATLRAADGLNIPDYWSGAGAIGKQGELLFGGIGGLTVLQPARQREWRYRPPVVITELRIKGQAVPGSRFNGGNNGGNTGSNNGSSNSGNGGSQGADAPLVIAPQANNSLSVEFAALDFSAPELNRYSYQLEGHDADWTVVDAAHRTASFTNLAPGQYRLRLRGSNRNGLWSEEERILPLQVLPAWYQSSWFRALLLLLLGAIIWLAIHARTGYLRRRQHQLEQQIQSHTRRLNEQQAELVQQAKLASIGTLAAGVAHEINNPANFALVGSYNMQQQLTDFHQLLLKLAGEDATPDFIQLLKQRFEILNNSLDAITEGATRIRDLVRDLRTFSRLDEADLKAVSLTESLASTINLVRSQYADTMKISLEFSAHPMLECCPVQLNQVFMNLIVNAQQAIAARSPELKQRVPGLLRIRNRIEGDQVLFEFEDNGIGIDPACQPHIFDPFFTTKTVGQGIGMGLSVSFGIMEQHHGSIAVRSEPGKGSCFTLRLPLPKEVLLVT